MASNLKISYIVIAVLLMATAFFALRGNLSSQIQTASVGKPVLCTKNNSCDSRTVGSGFRCDKQEVFVADGEYWCECNKKCEVEREYFK